MTSMPDLLYGFKEHFAVPLFINLKVYYSPFCSLFVVFVIKLSGGMLLIILHLPKISNTHLLGFLMNTQNFYPIFSRNQ